MQMKRSSSQSSESGSPDDDTKPSPSKRVKSAKPRDEKSSSGSPKGKQIKKPWTASEDAIFWSIVNDHLKKTLWSAIKEDGRLEYRGMPGVRAHAIAMMNKVKKDTPGHQ